MDEKLAELYGALMGDGCLSLYYSNFDKRKRFCTLFTGHTHDEPYYRNKLQPILLNVFKTKGYIQFRKKSNAVLFLSLKKDVFNYFKNSNFPIGKKKYLKIPKNILINNNFSLSCIRGIFDTDGSIYRRYSKPYKNHSKTYKYQVIQFKMNSEKTIKQVKTILTKNNINTNKIIKDKNSFVLRITEQQSIKDFFNIIKPNNDYHTERYLNSL